MYATIRYQIVSLFSMRAIQTNAHTARTLPCPTPAALKLAVLAKLIERDGADSAQEILDWLAPLDVFWASPDRLAVSTHTVRVWKENNKKETKASEPLISSVGMREYVHAEQPFELAVGPVPTEHQSAVAYGLEQIRALGNAESMVQPLGPVNWREKLPPSCVALTIDEVESDLQGIAVVVDDLGISPAWERMNVYRDHDRKLIPRIGEDRVRRIATLPLEVDRWSESGYSLAALNRDRDEAQS